MECLIRSLTYCEYGNSILSTIDKLLVYKRLIVLSNYRFRYTRSCEVCSLFAATISSICLSSFPSVVLLLSFYRHYQVSEIWWTFQALCLSAFRHRLCSASFESTFMFRLAIDYMLCYAKYLSDRTIRTRYRRVYSTQQDPSMKHRFLELAVYVTPKTMKYQDATSGLVRSWARSESHSLPYTRSSTL